MIGERIRKLREAHGYKQNEFAKLIGERKQNLYKYEKNIITNIPLDKIERMASVLCVSPAFLAGWNDDPYSVSDPVEKTLLDKYRELDQKGQSMLLDYIDFIVEKYKMKN